MKFIAFSLVFSALAVAQPAVVQNNTGQCVTLNVSSPTHIPRTGSCTFSANVTAGNVIVLGIGVRTDTATTISSISTVQTSGYSVMGSAISITGASGAGAALYCGVVTGSGAETVVVTMDAILFFGNLVMTEVSGTNGCTLSGPGTGASSTTSGINAYTPGSQAIATNSILLNAIYTNTTNSDLALTSGYTVNGLYNNGGTTRSFGMQSAVAMRR